MRCIRLSERKIQIIDVDRMQDSEDVEQLLTEDFGFKLSEIDWMVTESLKRAELGKLYYCGTLVKQESTYTCRRGHNAGATGGCDF
jgi:hypothetical protein